MMSGRFRILRAQVPDKDLARQAIVEVHGRTLGDTNTLVDFLADPTRYLLLAIEGDRVVGSLNGYALRPPHRPEPQFLLYEVDVRPECRNQGAGKALVERFILEARAAGAFEVWVVTNQSNAAAMAMHSSCGLHCEHSDDVVLNILLNEGNARNRD